MRLVGVGDYFLSTRKKKKNFCFEVQQLLQQAASSGIGVVGFQSLVFLVFLFYFIHFFLKKF
jgi:hypothetical protein